MKCSFWLVLSLVAAAAAASAAEPKRTAQTKGARAKPLVTMAESKDAVTLRSVPTSNGSTVLVPGLYAAAPFNLIVVVPAPNDGGILHAPGLHPDQRAVVPPPEATLIPLTR